MGPAIIEDPMGPVVIEDPQTESTFGDFNDQNSCTMQDSKGYSFPVVGGMAYNLMSLSDCALFC